MSACFFLLSSSASNAETVYVKYEKGYAQFTVRKSDDDVKEAEETTVDWSEIPGGKRFIVEIRDMTEEEQLDCVDSSELFYEDETTKYYFNVIKSQYIWVVFNNGNGEDIVTALNAGRATITDLDKFGIEYYTEPKK